MGIGFRELLMFGILGALIAIPIIIYRHSVRHGRRFAVYEHPVLGFEAVKIGFSYPALFFGFIWMLSKKLWKLAAVWVGLYLGCGVIEAIADQSPASGAQVIVYLAILAAYLVLWILPGIRGNEWRERDLVRRGYVRGPIVVAPTPAAAVATGVRQSGPAVMAG